MRLLYLKFILEYIYRRSERMKMIEVGSYDGARKIGNGGIDVFVWEFSPSYFSSDNELTGYIVS